MNVKELQVDLLSPEVFDHKGVRLHAGRPDSILLDYLRLELVAVLPLVQCRDAKMVGTVSFELCVDASHLHSLAF